MRKHNTLLEITALVLLTTQAASGQSLECPVGAKQKRVDVGAEHFWLHCEAPDPSGTRIKHGPSRSWFGNGNRRLFGNYERGRRVGVWKSWFVTGTRSSVVTHRNGVPEGPMTFYHPNGKIRAMGQALGGRRHGTWSFFYADGSKSSEETFFGAVRYGPVSVWYRNGQIAQKGAYRNAKEHGPWTSWHRNGQKSEQGDASDGRKNNWRRWDENGVAEEGPPIQDGSGPVRRYLNTRN